MSDVSLPDSHRLEAVKQFDPAVSLFKIPCYAFSPLRACDDYEISRAESSSFDPHPADGPPPCQPLTAAEHSISDTPPSPSSQPTVEKLSVLFGGLPIPAASTTSGSDLDAKAWRRKLEDEEIERYLIDFGKHVHHLRVPTAVQPLPAVAKPRVIDYTYSALSERRARDTILVKGDEPDGEALRLVELTSVDGKAGLPPNYSIGDIDWLAYTSAYSRYLVGPSTPLPPLEPFTVARLRSNGERLYTVARPTWEGVGQAVGDVCLWKSKARTSIVVLVYTGLMITSTLLPALFLSGLYPLVKRRLLPASPLAEYHESLTARQRTEEIATLAEELIEPDHLEAEDFQPGQGLAIGVDLSKAKESLGLGGVAGVDELVGDSGKKGERKRKLRVKLKGFEEEYGAGTVVVLGDLADLHEKVKNLYLWRSPSSSVTFAFILATLTLASSLCPLWILVKLVQIALGVVAFVVVPLIAAQERYEPMSWMAGSAPTDAEYAMELIKRRAAAGEPLVIPRLASSSSTTASDRRSLSSPSTTSLVSSSSGSEVVNKAEKQNMEKLKRFGQKGFNLLETSRQIAAGEREVKVSFAPAGSSPSGPLPPDVKSLMQLSLRRGGPGIVLTQQGKGDEAPTSYFAQYGSTSGHLHISDETITFRPLIPAKPNSKAIPAEFDTGFVGVGEGVTPEAGSTKVKQKSKTVDIAMVDVVGIKKRDKTSLLVVVAAGLEIECVDGTITSFALVSNRDHAFRRLLVLSNKSFAKV